MVNCKSLTDEETKNLADDLYKGLIFTDRHVKNPQDVQRVFIPLVLLNQEQIEEIKTNPPGLIYEYMDRAGPMAINGMPMFLSLRMLNQEDAKKVLQKYNQIKEAIEKV